MLEDTELTRPTLQTINSTSCAIIGYYACFTNVSAYDLHVSSNSESDNVDSGLHALVSTPASIRSGTPTHNINEEWVYNRKQSNYCDQNYLAQYSINMRFHYNNNADNSTYTYKGF